MQDKSAIRQKHKYTAEDIVALYMKKRIPVLVKHGVAAIWEGTYRVIKQTSRGPIRTKERKPVTTRSVTRTKQGFVDSFNIIMASFTNYNFLAQTVPGVLSTKGRQRNSLHLREVDSRRRTMIFEHLFARYFKEDVIAYKLKLETKE
jgi:hypothetical protein